MGAKTKTAAHFLEENGERAAWWYEDSRGISVYMQRKDGGVWGHSTSCLIPWRAIRAAVKRKDQP